MLKAQCSSWRLFSDYIADSSFAPLSALVSCRKRELMAAASTGFFFVDILSHLNIIHASVVLQRNNY